VRGPLLLFLFPCRRWGGVVFLSFPLLSCSKANIVLTVLYALRLRLPWWAQPLFFTPGVNVKMSPFSPPFFSPLSGRDSGLLPIRKSPPSNEFGLPPFFSLPFGTAFKEAGLSCNPNHRYLIFSFLPLPSEIERLIPFPSFPLILIDAQSSRLRAIVSFRESGTFPPFLPFKNRIAL